jgi:hypothetical protein
LFGLKVIFRVALLLYKICTIISTPNLKKVNYLFEGWRHFLVIDRGIFTTRAVILVAGHGGQGADTVYNIRQRSNNGLTRLNMGCQISQ